MLFQFVGGNLAIDFANTIVALDGKRLDLLSDKVVLGKWFDAAGFKVKEGINNAAFGRAVALRDAIKSILVAYHEDTPPEPAAINCINDHLSHRNHSTLEATRNGGFQLSAKPETWTIDTALAEIASEAINLLVNTPKAALKVCAAHNCILHFKDGSKAKRRRWCSMETCGNRAKAAAHYQRSIT